jgi:hypothetical protein
MVIGECFGASMREPLIRYIAMLLLHECPTLVPSTVSFRTLWALARLCDEYYPTREYVEPFISSWLDLHLPAALETPSFGWLYTS